MCKIANSPLTPTIMTIFSFPALLIAKHMYDKSKGKHSRGSLYFYLGSKECAFTGNTDNKNFKS